MANSPIGQAGNIVHAIDFRDGKPLHHAVLDHFAATATTFFRGLEDHRYGTYEIARLCQILRRSQKHCGVSVMAASVHLACGVRCPWLARDLRQRQRIHVRAQSHRRAFAVTPPYDADDAGTADPRLHDVTTELVQLIRDEPGRLVHIEHQLGIRMQMMTPL